MNLNNLCLPEYLLVRESVEVFLAGVFLVGEGR